MRKMMMTAAIAAVMTAAPVAAQNQGGLVNVNVSQIRVDLEDVISDNNIGVQIPVNAIVSVPIGIAANICNVSAAVLAKQAADAAPCTATSDTASRAEMNTLARSLQRN